MDFFHTWQNFLSLHAPHWFDKYILFHLINQMFIVALAASHGKSAALCYTWAMLHWPVTQEAIYHKDTQSRSISLLKITHVSYGELNWGIF